jgi:hypothetical protein
MRGMREDVLRSAAVAASGRAGLHAPLTVNAGE